MRIARLATLLTLSAALLLLLLPPTRSAQPAPPAAPPAPAPAAPAPAPDPLAPARAAMADRDYPAAATAFLAAVAANPAAPDADAALFLAAKAQFLARSFAAAADVAARVEKEYPKSPLLLKARYLRAEAKIQLREHGPAADLLRERAELLGSPETRAALAGFYLELAREFYVPPAPTTNPTENEASHPPDFARAATLFTAARDVGLPEERAPEVLTALAYCHLRTGNLAAAEAAAQEVVRDYKKYSARAEALFLLGAVEFGQQKWSAARELYQTLIDEYPASAWVPRSRFRIGESYAPLAPRDATDRDNGIAAWRTVVEKHGDDGHAPLAQLGIASALSAQGDTAGAIAGWREFLRRWPKHADAPKAQFAVAQSLLAQHKFDDAAAAASEFLAAFPSDPLWTSAQNLIVEAAFARGTIAVADKDHEKAVAAWSRFIDQFPLSPRAPQAQFGLGEVRAAQERWSDAIAEWQRAAAKYPQDGAAPAALLKAARAIEDKLGKMEEALAGYERVAKDYGATPFGREAGLRATQMKEKFLLLRVDRAYTSAEPAQLHVETRNIEKLELRAYKLDLLEYFRKKSSIAGFEQIAVEVVKPDSTWEEPTREYARLKLIARELELPLKGEGAWIVVARGGDYTATTLVLISDVSVVTKEAPQQLLVWAKDEVTGKPAPDVTVLVSDGATLVADGKTGADGVWTREFERPRGNVRVFAYRKGSYASNESALTNLAVWGYQTKCYLYTDRPVYRPNQAVRLKGVLRRVKAGYYDVSAGEKMKLSVRDPNGLVLLDRELTTNDFGTVADEVFLGDAPALGSYAITAMVGDSPYSGEFQVEEYRKPEFTVDVKPEREAYALGETVKAKVQVTYTFGGGVPGAELTVRAVKAPYQFDTTKYADYAWYYSTMAKADEEQRKERQGGGAGEPAEEPLLETTLRTNEKGEAELTIPTGHVDRNVAIGIIVLARDVTNRWVSGYASVPMTARSFWSVVKTAKKLFQPKEKIAATLIAVNAAETPLATEGKLVVLRRRMDGGQVVEEPISEAPAATAENGRGEVVFTLDKPGEYLLRYVGNDRARKQPGEEGSTSITVEGAAEDLAKQARIVADRREYKRGETARVVVNSPIENVSALLTFEGEKVFEYQVLELKDRATTLSIPMKDAYCPNVFLSIAIPHKNTLYADTEQVYVFKFATLSVAARTGEARPGGQVTFDVTATDQNGQPVAAEFSLGLVDEAVYSIAGEKTPHILGHFYAGARQNAVVTRCSYEFKHAAQTKTVSADLKKEMSRRAQASSVALLEAGRRAEESGRMMEAMDEVAAMEATGGVSDAIGVGGGGGGAGSYGGAFGGRVNRRAHGGGAATGAPAPASPPAGAANAPGRDGSKKNGELRERAKLKDAKGDMAFAEADA
ncbi:MAG: tetratricopeptide repeat protein, partial [Planctomycetes bacterium]|nr:tetratricopeptide repeat protein [Planctomycetota bacterium]